jgi:hypothetical protein
MIKYFFQTCEFNRTSVDSDLVCIDDDDDDEANFETTENLQTHPDQFHYDEDLQTYDHFQNPKNEISFDETESSDSSSDSEIDARTNKKKVFSKKSGKNSPNLKTSSSESEEENAYSISSLSKKDCVNVKSSKQNKTFSKKLEQNSSDSEDDNDFISEPSKNKKMSSKHSSFKEQKKKSKESESNSESSRSEDEQEPIAKSFKTKEKSVKENILLNQSKTSNKSSSDSETSSSEYESNDEPSRFIKKYFKLFSSKPSENHTKNSSSECSSNTSSSEGEQKSISKSTKKSVKPSTKEPKKTSSKIPEHCQISSNIETSSSEDDDQQTNSEISDSNKKSTKNQSCSKYSENPKKAKTSKALSSTTSSEISSTSSNETSSSSDDEEKLIHEPSNSAKKPMTSSFVKQPLSKTSEGAKKISSKTPKQISSNVESSSSDSEEDSIAPPVKPKKAPTKKSTSNQSKATNKKSTFESTKNDSEKSYEDFSPIMEGYGDLLDSLNPDDPKSEVDKVVKFILDKNILVRHVNVLLSKISKSESQSFYSKIQGMGNLKVGRYTPGEFGDDACLRKRWDELVENVPIRDKDQCFQDFSNLKLMLRKRNVLGCFLGQDLPHVRHAADIFHHACKLFKQVTIGRFSKEEDAIILKEVKQSGACFSTWKRLANQFSRIRHKSIERRYNLLINGQKFTHGSWTLDEDEILIETLFEGKKETGVDEIKAIYDTGLVPCAEKINRPLQNVTQRWTRILQPILVSYHYGTLLRPWRKEFLKYVVEKKIVGSQEVSYSDIFTKFPEQSVDTINHILSCFKTRETHKPLYKSIEEHLPTYKDSLETDRVQRHREEIVRIYDEVKNRII